MSKKLTSITTYGKLSHGKILFDHRAYFDTVLSTFDDTEVQVEISAKKGTRTLKQNAYLWGVAYPEIAKHTGHSAEELHQIFKAKFLQSKKTWRGGTFVVHRSTSELTNEEMGDFITEVCQEAGELGIEIPLPDKEYAVHRDFAI